MMLGSHLIRTAPTFGNLTGRISQFSPLEGCPDCNALMTHGCFPYRLAALVNRGSLAHADFATVPCGGSHCPRCPVHLYEISLSLDGTNLVSQPSVTSSHPRPLSSDTVCTVSTLVLSSSDSQHPAGRYKAYNPTPIGMFPKLCCCGRYDSESDAHSHAIEWR